MRPGSRTLGALIDELAAARPDADAIVFRGERLTFAALRDRSDAIARAFLAVGVRKDDRIAILLPNRPEWLIAAFPAAKVSAVDVCYILYTSGSTATPKGVMLAHGGVIDNGFDIGERQHLTAADRVWLAVPLFWSFGSANALPAILTHGGTLVMQESFEPGEALALLDGERCSVYYGMANMARAILEHPERPRRALAAMRTGLTIGLPEDVAMTMEAVNARQLCNVYGATETYGNCAVTDAHDSLERRLTTQGLPLPGMQIRVVEPGSDRPLPPDEVGELRVRGCVTPGYYRDAEQTRAAFDADGFFVTGDLGTVGGDGRIRFRGRLKEMIKTGGINVAPLEVEAVLLAHPAAKQAYAARLSDRVK